MAQPLRLATLLAILAFPILEIGLLIRAGQSLGFWWLVLIVVGTAMLGTAVIRRTGLSVLTKARAQMDSGGLGVNPLLDGLMQISAGMLLIFPGLISDVIGLLLLVPAIRTYMMTSVLPKLFAVTMFGTSRADPFRQSAEPDAGPSASSGFDAARDSGVTIEGEYERVSEEPVESDKALKPRPARRSAR